MKVTIRPLTEGDLPTARSIISLAFGTFPGAPEPEKFWPDLDYAATRWRADPTSTFAAEIDGELVGSNFGTRWGSVGVMGPITVRPDLWGKGIAGQLMVPLMEYFDNWNVKHVGLLTFPNSLKHIGLYQKYGFWPRFLTAIMSKPLSSKTNQAHGVKYSGVPKGERDSCLRDCRKLTNSLCSGLDLEREIRAVSSQGLGDTVLIWNEQDLIGFAVCHCGSNTEAGAESKRTSRCLTWLYHGFSGSGDV